METDGLRARKRAGERAEARKGEGGPFLVEEADGGGDARLRIARRERGGGRVLPLGRHGSLEPLERDPVEQLRPHVGTPGRPRQRRELRLRRSAGERGGGARTPGEKPPGPRGGGGGEGVPPPRPRGGGARPPPGPP